MTEQQEYTFINIDEIPCEEISDSHALVKEPLVSVKMLTYNHELYIGQAIQGVLQQKTNFPFELVIGEDCSTDSTREIVFDYQKKYPDIIMVITSDKNVGANKNSKRTTKACRGKYIAFCEGDDYWTDPYKLHKQVDFLEANPDYGMLHTDGDNYYVKDDFTIKNYIIKERGDLSLLDNPFESILKSEYPVLTCSVMLRSSILHQIIEECAEDMMRFKMADTFLWLESIQRSKVHFIAENMVQHNILLESAAHSESLEKILNFKESGFELIKYFAEKYNVTSDVKRESYSRFITGISNLAYKLNNDKKIEELATEKPLSKIVMLKLSLLLIGLRKRLLYKPIGLIVKMINVIERNVK